MSKKRPPLFKFQPFSEKQIKVLKWWQDDSPHKNKDGIICDGSVRAGKTVVMSLSFVMWAMEAFADENLGMSGKTIGSFRRNVFKPLVKMLRSRGYKVKEFRSENMFTVTRKGITNSFYIFGGRDESSQDLIQGITLAGMFFDEVALMPQSFVNQATARCSVDGAKMWFNCNPEGPYHWFKLEYLDQLDSKNMLHLHFTMDDNLSLSQRVKERYKRMYSGVFYQRYILGLWVLAEGVIYDMFDKMKHAVATVSRAYTEYYVSCDYGTQNPMTFGLWGKIQDVWYKVKEYHYDGRKEAKQKSDEEYVQDLKDFIGALTVRAVVVDPSAASFITALRKAKIRVIEAKNAVADGIRNVASALVNGLIKYNDCCKETFREYSSYIWDKKAGDRGEDKPVKENDHQLDADRYFVNTVIYGRLEVKATANPFAK